jgi:hypothetical protein
VEHLFSFSSLLSNAFPICTFSCVTFYVDIHHLGSNQKSVSNLMSVVHIIEYRYFIINLLFFTLTITSQ